MTDAVELLAVAKRAAAAGAAVLSRRSAAGTGGAGLGMSNKGDAGDWVTEFDVAAENAVREAILAERPNDTITGEEHGTTRPEQPSGYCWSIDPLDGTTNFIRNIVYYATSVAVADADGVWLAGVVHAPALGRVYSAARGEGAWLEVAGETTRLAGPVPGRTGLILATGFSYDPDTRANQAEGLAELMNGFADVRRLGSAALDLCLVADGTYDAFGERGLNEHDFSAGALIAEEAGCWVRRPRLESPLDGGPAIEDRLAAWTCAGALELSGKFPFDQRPVPVIKTLAIANYRSIRDLAVELHGLDVVTGANGSGKSSLYRALRLLAECAGGDSGNVVGSLARDGGLASTLWAGPESISEAMRRGEVPVQGTVRRDSVNLKLGYSGDDFGYLVDLGMPVSSGAGFDQETGRPRPSAFSLDPEIKREQIFSGPVARQGSLLVDRKGSLAKLRGADGDWTELSRRLDTFQSMLTEVSDQDRAPEVLRVRDSVRSWRFYDHFRTDAEAPARQAQLGTRTPVLHHSGKDLAAALQTLREVGFERQLDAAVDHAFPGSRLEIAVSDGRFSVELRQPGMLRPMKAAELSDGTLRFLLLTAALLTPRPPELMVLNEPETSLHVDLMPALAGLIVQASANSQMIVVTHSEALLRALRESGAAHEHELYKDLGETRIKGLGSLEGPLWSWPKR